MLGINLQLVLFAICVGGFTLAAAITDARTRRIPNKLTLPMFLLGLIYQLAFNGWSGSPEFGIGEAGLANALLGFALGFGTLFVLWLVGGGGGGDVKLMGALSIWLGFQLTLLVMIVSTLFVVLGAAGIVLWSLIAGAMSGNRLAGETKDDSADAPVTDSEAPRKQRPVMAYALPVALATWLVAIWKMPFVQ